MELIFKKSIFQEFAYKNEHNFTISGSDLHINQQIFTIFFYRIGSK